MKWEPIETAPKGGGAERRNDPNWVEPPNILLRFGEQGASVGYWDWYYIYNNETKEAWVEPCSGDLLERHFTTPATHWMSIPGLEG